jgi:phage terminase small subunit
MGRPTKKPKLTPKQKKFVNEYLIDLNAAAAARRAGYSKNAARVIGPENLSKPAVMEYLKQRRKELGSDGITPERVLEEYSKLAFLDPVELVDKNGRLLDLNNISPNARAAIGGVEQEIFKLGKSGVKIKTKYKIIDKKGSLDSIARTLGMFEKDNAQKAMDIEGLKINVNFVSPDDKRN